MPRYKDIDAILKKLPDDLPYKASVKRVLMQAPEADVVPRKEYDAVVNAVDNSTKEFLKLHDLYQNEKREVERLENILNSYALQYGTVAGQHKVTENIKADVAREIFEEIENIFGKHMLWYRFNEAQYQLYVELKNKYTEETDGKQA